MPELPEVETIRTDLERTVLGRRIRAVFLHDPLIVRYPDPGTFVGGLTGRTITCARRRGKYLLLGLDDDRIWVIHLMLEGQLLYERADTPIARATKLVVALDDGHELRLRDVVGFARTLLGDEGQLQEVLNLSRLGPEPTTPAFTLEEFTRRLAGRRAQIKPLLLDQKVFAGIGNLYADEALFRARLHPQRKASSLTPDELTRLHRAVREVIREGLAHRGTSAPGGLYRDLFGRKGFHQDYLQVFRRTGRRCPGCPGHVEEIQVGGRPTFYCPACQPASPVPSSPAGDSRQGKIAGSAPVSSERSR